MPKTSRPTWSASSISSSRFCMRWTGLIVRPVAGSEMAAAKLSTPICMFATPGISERFDDDLVRLVADPKFFLRFSSRRSLDEHQSPPRAHRCARLDSVSTEQLRQESHQPPTAPLGASDPLEKRSYRSFGGSTRRHP